MHAVDENALGGSDLFFKYSPGSVCFCFLFLFWGAMGVPFVVVVVVVVVVACLFFVAFQLLLACKRTYHVTLI